VGNKPVVPHRRPNENVTYPSDRIVESMNARPPYRGGHSSR